MLVRETDGGSNTGLWMLGGLAVVVAGAVGVWAIARGDDGKDERRHNDNRHTDTREVASKDAIIARLEAEKSSDNKVSALADRLEVRVAMLESESKLHTERHNNHSEQCQARDETIMEQAKERFVPWLRTVPPAGDTPEQVE